MYNQLQSKQPWGCMSLLPATTCQDPPAHFISITSGYENTANMEAGDTSIQQLLEWVNSNVCQSRPFRSPQLYLWGPPACGKTSFLRLLEKYLRVYYMPTDENFYDFYDDDSYDLIVVDEFKGQKTIQDINRWLDGQNMTIRMKGRQSLKYKNLPIIIVSNFPPHIVYRNKFEKGELEPFTSRLYVVEVKGMIPLDRIVVTPKVEEMEEEAAEKEETQIEDVAPARDRIVVDLISPDTSMDLC